MDFGFTSDQEMLRQTFAKLMAEECSLAQVKEWMRDEVGFSEILWKEMGRLGWLGLIYGEEYGGSQGTLLDLFILFEEMGKALLPSPFFTSAVLCGMLISEAGDEALKRSYMPPMILGDKILTLALLNEKGEYGGNHSRIEATEEPGGTYLIHGTRVLVPYAHVADEILLCANVRGPEGGGTTVFKMQKDPATACLTPLDALGCHKNFSITFQNAVALETDIVGESGKGASYLERILPKATTLKCGEMIGGLDRVVDMTVAYAKERHQFGRPIGSFQIIQHYCADMASYLETSRLMAYQAASLLSQGESCHKEIAMAKAWCNEAYKKSTWLAHQIHGGMGFTEECDLHLFYKHAKEAELSFGGSLYHRGVVADVMGI